MSLLGRLKYISMFISQLTTTCEPIFKLLKKDDAVKWTDECQEAFDKIKEYLLDLPHDITSRKEKVIYYLSKKFTSYEVRYTPLERTCCALTWVAQKLKHYLSSCTTYLISRLDPLKYIFQKPMPKGRLEKWQILLTEFEIIYVTRTAMKAQALVDHLVENPEDEEYEPLRTFFPDEEVIHIDEVEKDENPGWKLFFDGAANMKGIGIGVVLISKIGHHYPVTAQLRFYYTNNMDEYKACFLGLRLAVDMGVQEVLVWGDLDLHIPRIHNEVAEALATLSSMLHHPDKAYVDPLHIQVCDQYAYCNMVEEELDGEPWFHDIREYIRSGIYSVQATRDQKRTIQRLASGFFFSGGVLYKRTPDLGLLRCTDARQATTVHGDLIHSSPSELHTMSTPWPFVVWGMDVIEPIKPAVSNGHRFILVAIDYFTKWVEAKTFKSVTKKFKIMHRNSTPYRPTANGAVEAANKNIKKILRKMVQEAVIPTEVEIPSLRIVSEAETDDDEWVKTRLEQLSLIDEKRLAALCHGQLYQKIMAKAYNKKKANV
ncbi:uncharacterized protein [Nicotiana sylvestris]|uniref:uncharacterized protein n=1 Tax=Nicotiana sylvestris TaxID=4096 RepID=UPI00388C40CD